MKADIHPKYEAINVQCSCGNTFQTKSTAANDLKIDVCSSCHPYYTGEQKIMDTEGRVETFNKRFGRFSKKK